MILVLWQPPLPGCCSIHPHNPCPWHTHTSSSPWYHKRTSFNSSLAPSACHVPFPAPQIAPFRHVVAALISRGYSLQLQSVSARASPLSSSATSAIAESSTIPLSILINVKFYIPVAKFSAPRPARFLNCASLYTGANSMKGWLQALTGRLQALPHLVRLTNIKSISAGTGEGEAALEAVSNLDLELPNSSHCPDSCQHQNKIDTLALAVLGTGSSVEPTLVILHSLKSPSSIFSLYYLVLFVASYCSFLFCQTRSHLEKLPHTLPCRGGVPWFSGRQFRSPLSSFASLLPSGSYLCDPLLISLQLHLGLHSFCFPLPYLSSVAVSIPSSCCWSPWPFSYPLPLTDLPRLSCYILFSSSLVDFSCSVGRAACDLMCLPPNAELLELHCPFEAQTDLLVRAL